MLSRLSSCQDHVLSRLSNCQMTIICNVLCLSAYLQYLICIVKHVILFSSLLIFCSKSFIVISLQNDNYFRVAAEIDRYNILMNFLCDSYFDSDRFCIAMKNSFFRLKYFECVRNKKFCVNMSWTFLNNIRKDFNSKIAADEKKLITIITHLLQNKKILKEVNAKAKRKIQCLLFEMNETNVSMSNNCFVRL